ncbi:MAG: hypothetical protein EP330_18065 [Deltaproteobacteria bacterium]|nr:MAG: hypothetical protein EP330_18065 [Deltaproteobacteria bacterium]
MRALLLVLVACAPAIPPACPSMCEEAAELYGGCLESWDLDWQAAGYDHRGHFVGSCETWAWEMARVHDDALRRGLTQDETWLDQTCEARAASFADPEATCDDYTSVDWNAVPWSEASQ